MTPLILFDVDKTIVRGFTGFYATLELIRSGIIKKRRLPKALFHRLLAPFLYEGKNAPLQELYQIAINDMAGHTLEEILRLGRHCFEKWIRPRIYREALTEIEGHKGAGHPVYLVTSGPTMVIQILAEYLGVTGFYSGGPVIDAEGRLTSRLRLPIYYREGKVAAALELLAKHGIGWESLHFYSDNSDDLFLLEKVGHPHLVNPDRRLRTLALERNWPVLRFSTVLGKKNP